MLPLISILLSAIAIKQLKVSEALSFPGPSGAPDSSMPGKDGEPASSSAASTLFFEGNALFQEGDLPNSVLKYRAALEVDPEHADAWTNCE